MWSDRSGAEEPGCGTARPKPWEVDDELWSVIGPLLPTASTPRQENPMILPVSRPRGGDTPSPLGEGDRPHPDRGS